MRSESVSGRARRTARRLSTIPYPALAAPSLALCARPTLRLPLSPSSLPLSALASAGPFVPRSPCPRPRCTLPATHLSLSLSPLPPPGALASRLVARWSLRTPLRPSSLFARLASPSLPCPVSPLPLAGHRVGKSHARTWPSLYVSTLRSALSGAPAYCGRLARLWGTFVLLPHAHPFMPPWHALVPALPSLPLRPPASGAIRVAAPSLCPLSLSWPLGPVLPPVCSPSLVPTCPPSQVPWSLALSVSALVFPLPSRHAFRGATREAPLPLPLHLAAPWFPGSACTAARGPLLPPYLPLPPLPLPLSILTFCSHAGHFVGMSHACRRFASAPPFLPRPFPPHLHAEHFAGHCVGKLHARRRHAPGPLCVTLRGADRFAPTRRGAPPCPVPLRIAGGSLGGGAPLSFRPTLAPACRRGTPPALPCLLCPSALRPARAQCGAIRVAALPLCPLSLPWPLGPVLPPVCSPSLVLSCPLSQVPWSLVLGVPVPVLSSPSQLTRRGAIREAPLPLPLHLAAPWRPGSVRTGPQPAALFSRPTSPSLPCPFPPLHSAVHFAGHFVGISHACRRHTPGPSLSALPCPLSTLRRALRRTLC